MKLLFVLSLSLLLSGQDLVKANEEVIMFSRIRFKIKENGNFYHLFFNGEEIKVLSVYSAEGEIGSCVGINLFAFIFPKGKTLDNGTEVKIVLIDNNNKAWRLNWKMKTKTRKSKLSLELAEETESSTLWRVWKKEREDGSVGYRFEYNNSGKYLHLNVHRKVRSNNLPLFSLFKAHTYNIHLDSQTKFLYRFNEDVHLIDIKNYHPPFELGIFEAIEPEEVKDPSLKCIPQKQSYVRNQDYSIAMSTYLKKVHSYLNKPQETTEIERAQSPTNS